MTDQEPLRITPKQFEEVMLRVGFTRAELDLPPLALGKLPCPPSIATCEQILRERPKLRLVLPLAGV